MEKFYLSLEIVGTVAFSVSGVITAINKKLDFFGAVVLGLMTAVGGGIFRDMILGYLPPETFRKPTQLLISICVSVTSFIITWICGKKVTNHIEDFSPVINIFDSVGLSVFTVAGVNAAHNCGFSENGYLAVFVGVMTAVGGGVLRDIMVSDIPMILRKRVYALASLVGALVYQLLLEYTSTPHYIAVIVCLILIFSIRILATIFKWNLPVVK